MFQQDEIVNLIYGIGGLIIILTMLRRIYSDRIKLFLIGYLVLVVAYIATVLEGVIWPDALNIIEHTGYAVTGILFAIAVWMNLRASKDEAEK